MVRIFTIFTLLLLFSVASFAQTPATHEKKTYVDKNGRFYVNRNLPMYLRLSTTPDGADSHLLKSESTPQYANPFYFDTEGKNTVKTPWQVDPKTRKQVLPLKDLVFEVYADGLAPKTAVKFSEAPKYRTGGKTYYGKGLKITLTAQDAVSGVEKIFYSLNGAAYQQYTAVLDADTEGEFTLAYYALDNVGNAETPKTVSYIVDRLAPVARYKINGIKSGDFVSPNTTISLSATDDRSGVNRIMYMIDGSKELHYRKAINLMRLKAGEHKLVYFSADNVKNSSTKEYIFANNKFVFNVDFTAPDVTINVKGDQHIGKYHYVSQRTDFELLAQDKQSGVSEINYNINSTLLSKKYTNFFKVSGQQGMKTIYFSAIDNVQNIASKKSKKVYLDIKSPVTGINFGKPQFFTRDTLFINSKTKISFFARDTDAGVAKTEYNINGAAYADYNSPILVSKNGANKIYFRSTDRVNNVESEKTSLVFVDNQSPEIFINFSIEAIDNKSKDGVNYPVYPSYTRMYISATDIHCGTESIFYSINGKAMKNYQSAQQNVTNRNMFTKNGFYTVKVIAKDKLGNERDKTISFFIEDK